VNFPTTCASGAGRTPLYPNPGFTFYSLGVGYEGPTVTIWDPEEIDSYLLLDFFVRYAESKTATSFHDGFDLTYGAHRFVSGLAVGFTFWPGYELGIQDGIFRFPPRMIE
jgi:hypothetical protein